MPRSSACSRTLLALCAAVGQCNGLEDSLSLAQAGLRAHRAVDPEDGHDIARRLKETMMSAYESSGLANGLIGERAKVNAEAAALGGMQSGEALHGAAVALGGAKQQQDLAVDLTQGIIFEREVRSLEEGTNLQLSLDHGCASTDRYGSNQCTLAANDKYRMRVTVTLGQPVGEGSTLTLNTTMKLIGASAVIAQQLAGGAVTGFQTTVPVVVTCAMCGEACDYEFLGKKYSQPMPACPIPANQEQVLLNDVVGMPTGSFMKLARLKSTTNFQVKRPDGNLIAEGDMHVRIGKVQETPCPEVKSLLGLCDQLPPRMH